MVEWLNANIAYWHWIVLGILLAGLEIFVPSFVILWFGVAGIAVGLLMVLFPIGVTAQLFIWGGLSVLLLVLWHKLVSPRMENRTLAGLSREAIIGQVGTVLEYSSARSRGNLRFPAPILGNDEWEFIFDGELRSGDRVMVTEVSGNALIVVPKN
ncbi:hypothetical protein BTA51_16240 [Hahella sp. CCB-MM4]|uniref:NfeD family protein n=1 Tax=Hahella sp. (strain CCB-MM4) TaxID=1926491 RepID=UPI000B9BF2DA|nr:NfeD family protein [Hahella sp. CCB-MM4]OZG72288.1 hypothetical protein BTA51_16240 [Hahella sp. CCB-MM4]